MDALLSQSNPPNRQDAERSACDTLKPFIVGWSPTLKHLTNFSLIFPTGDGGYLRHDFNNTNLVNVVVHYFYGVYGLYLNYPSPARHVWTFIERRLADLFDSCTTAYAGYYTAASQLLGRCPPPPPPPSLEEATLDDSQGLLDDTLPVETSSLELHITPGASGQAVVTHSPAAVVEIVEPALSPIQSGVVEQAVVTTSSPVAVTATFGSLSQSLAPPHGTKDLKALKRSLDEAGSDFSSEDSDTSISPAFSPITKSPIHSPSTAKGPLHRAGRKPTGGKPSGPWKGGSPKSQPARARRKLMK